MGSHMGSVKPGRETFHTLARKPHGLIKIGINLRSVPYAGTDKDLVYAHAELWFADSSLSSVPVCV